MGSMANHRTHKQLSERLVVERPSTWGGVVPDLHAVILTNKRSGNHITLDRHEVENLLRFLGIEVPIQ